MSKSTRLFLSLSEEVALFENAREQLGMNRSQYLRYLIGGQKEIRPTAIKNRGLISHIASIDRSLKVIAMKDELSEIEKLQVLTLLEDIKEMIRKEEG